MTEFAMLALILGFMYSYLSHEEKIKSRKLFKLLYIVIGLFLSTMAISYLIVNCYDLFS